MPLVKGLAQRWREQASMVSSLNTKGVSDYVIYAREASVFAEEQLSKGYTVQLSKGYTVLVGDDP